MMTNVNRGQPDLEAAMKSNTTTILVAVGALLVEPLELRTGAPLD